MTKQTLDQFYGQAIDLLVELKFPYVIIGGLAVSLIGEPRMTLDIDFILSIPEKDMLSAKSILIRHRGKLDRKYIEKWAQRISDEAQDMSCGIGY